MSALNFISILLTGANQLQRLVLQRRCHRELRETSRARGSAHAAFAGALPVPHYIA